MKRTIILPAYNEMGYIATMIELSIGELQKRSEPFEIIVINNASTDNTSDIVADIERRDSRVRLISHPENRLYAGSCLTGVQAATGERIFILDSDGQHLPKDLWCFDQKLEEGYDVVFGWRTQRKEPLFRWAMSKLLWLYSKYYLDFHLHDVNCGFRAFNRSYAEKLSIQYQVNMVNPELFVRAKLGGFKIGEAKVVQEKRKAGISSHQFGRLWDIHRAITKYLANLSQELKHSKLCETEELKN